jgi:septation ring formation regulator EzrA
MATPSVNKLAEDVSYLSRDMAVVNTLVGRLDTTIDKLTDISSSVSNLLAVHETKLTSQEIISKQLSDLVEARRVETDDKVQLLHERISSGERELKENIDDQYDELMKEIKEMRAESTVQHNTLSDRITAMEKWMWTVIGGAAIVGGIITLVPWSTIFGIG